MGNQPIMTHSATTDVYNAMQERFSRPELQNLVSKWHVNAEIVKDHLMKAEVSLPELGVKFTIFADEPKLIGGEESAMPPFGYFMAGAMMCELAQYMWNSVELGLVDKIFGVEAHLEGGFPITALYGIDKTPGAAAITGMKMTTKVTGTASAEEVNELAKLAASRCPAHQSLTGQVPYENEVHLNGSHVGGFASK